MRTRDFDYHLPAGHIAQHPADPRDSARLLHLDRATGRISHHIFRDISKFLRPGDILVANNSRVLPARLYGHKSATGGQVELLLLEQIDDTCWLALAGGKRLTPGTEITLHHRDGSPSTYTATIIAERDGPQREITLSAPAGELLPLLGHTPLPPYIHKPLADPERYQTVYARPAGSAAAPTAGLHFTPDLLMSLREKGVLFETCTLHVGLDTFQPVSAGRVAGHTIHSEWAELSPEAARRINEAKLAGGRNSGRIVAVGTTSTRVLETAALRSAGITGSLQTISAQDTASFLETPSGKVPPFPGNLAGTYCPWRPAAAFSGHTDLFIYPGYRFRAVDMLITNFHLPQSSLLMLVAAFLGEKGRETLLDAYQQAIVANYRFYSFGDAMLIS